MTARMSWLISPYILFVCASQFCSCNTEIYGAGGRQPEPKFFHHSCALKKDEGRCKALKDRFYFDVETNRCERFEYGGCEGNANNFETLEECEEMCVVKPNKSPCHLNEEVGPCRGIIIRYFFNSKSQRCEPFSYGGCLGNANNFRRMEECNAKCNKQKPETREMTGDTNSEPEKRPEVFISFGKTREGVSPPDLCLGPAEKGMCQESMRRYAYNPTSKRCHSFRYSGCGGNGNNFVSRKDCVKTCMRGVDNHNQRPTQAKTKRPQIIFESI